MDLMLLVAQAVNLGFITLWLSIGLRDNILYPSINETFTAEVLDLTRMRQDYPSCHDQMAQRRVQGRAAQRRVFWLAVAWEALTVLALWIALLAMAAALSGWVEAETARVIAMAAALMFTATWAGFLVIGNHFAYWLCHDGAQNTHYQMMLWGLGTMILLVSG